MIGDWIVVLIILVVATACLGTAHIIRGRRAKRSEIERQKAEEKCHKEQYLALLLSSDRFHEINRLYGKWMQKEKHWGISIEDFMASKGVSSHEMNLYATPPFTRENAEALEKDGVDWWHNCQEFMRQCANS